MSETDLFVASMRKAEDLAGIFEYDGAVAYLYLYEASKGETTRVLDAIRVFRGPTELTEADISVRWDDKETRVGLFVKGVQWASFNCETRQKFGGDNNKESVPPIPEQERF